MTEESLVVAIVHWDRPKKECVIERIDSEVEFGVERPCGTISSHEDLEILRLMADWEDLPYLLCRRPQHGDKVRRSEGLKKKQRVS